MELYLQELKNFSHLEPTKSLGIKNRSMFRIELGSYSGSSGHFSKKVNFAIFKTHFYKQNH